MSDADLQCRGLIWICPTSSHITALGKGKSLERSFFFFAVSLFSTKCRVEVLKYMTFKLYLMSHKMISYGMWKSKELRSAYAFIIVVIKVLSVFTDVQAKELDSDQPVHMQRLICIFHVLTRHKICYVMSIIYEVHMRPKVFKELTIYFNIT